jgi:hypothetical protein
MGSEKMTKTVGQGSIRQEKAQCNMRPASNLPDKALAYACRQAMYSRFGTGLSITMLTKPHAG